MDITLVYLLKRLLLPPASLLLMAAAGLCLRHYRLGMPLTVLSLVLLTLLSLPMVSKLLADAVESYPVLSTDALKAFQPQAIVVLGGGSHWGAEYQQPETVNAPTLLRLRYAAKLARATQLPILVAGGKVFSESASEAHSMAAVLQNEFNVPVAWQETTSHNTAENALYSRALLQAQGIDKILLVTQAYHTPRAVRAFTEAGFQVLAAPTAFIGHTVQASVLSYVPSAKAFEHSCLVLHELLGLLWYRLS
ncbi:YdcF family protein [Methylovulum psychrotolerans]|nr:YdcF family protein [Methylovulum psychrotolerans]